MKYLLAAVLLAALSAPAQAQRRPDTTAMSCAAAQALVARSGAIVLGTGGSTYDRFVRHRGFCTPSESTEPAFVRSADSPACFVGDRCIEKRNDPER